MKPEDIRRIVKVTDHVLSPDGTLAVMVVGTAGATELWSVPTSGAAAPRRLTSGPHDLAPAISPDGTRVAFLRRRGAGGRLCILDFADEAISVVAEHDRGLGLAVSVRHLRGVSPPAWSPSGRFLAYVAAVEKPRSGLGSVRRVAGMPFQIDDRGRIDDNHIQIFIAEAAAGASSRQFTTTPADHWDLCWRPDGAALCFASAEWLARRIASQALYEAEIDPGSGREVNRRCLTDGTSTVNNPAYSPDGETIAFVGIGRFPPTSPDIRARNASLWAIARDAAGAEPQRLTVAETFDFDESRLRPVIFDGTGEATVTALSRGGVHLGTIGNGGWAPLVSGNCQVSSYARSGPIVTAVIAHETDAGDLFVIGDQAPRRLTNFGSAYVDVSLRVSIELHAASRDGYPVHGWLVTPPTTGPHPLLLLIHGGPDTQWGYFLNEEAQAYAAAGFAVLMPNPRGSAGYGEAHARVLNGRLGTIDAEDILALLDVALAREDIDGSRVGVTGRSYGGFMTGWLAIRHTGKFRAAVGECGIYDWNSVVSTSDIGWQLTEMVGADPETWRALSPLGYVHPGVTPFMVMQYLSDLRIPFSQGRQLFATLLQSGVPTELVEFDGGPHSFAETGPPDERVARLEILIEWFGKWLGGVAGTPT
ncbi:MAG TPA: alpha/beta fold hydrolase [Stellaceae bacterium]|jgi:dipeptidyl aminopeptidase/acylaminoacyl peptidase